MRKSSKGLSKTTSYRDLWFETYDLHDHDETDYWRSGRTDCPVPFSTDMWLGTYMYIGIDKDIHWHVDIIRFVLKYDDKRWGKYWFT